MLKIITSVILFIFMITGLSWYLLRTPTKGLHNVSIRTSSKPVVLFVIDSLMDQPLQKAIEEGKAPAFEFLMKHGQYYPEVVSSYPTMSVTIDSTLLTGTYANDHKVPGLVWLKKDENRVINYGPGKIEFLDIGAKQILTDSLIHLNKAHLSRHVLTIYEELAKSEIQSASINGLIYRGNQVHRLNIPKLFTGMNLLPRNLEVNGPSLLSLGSLTQYNQENDGSNRIWKAAGVNDHFSANELKYFIEKNQLPPFTLVYFADLDHQVHKNGPMEQKGIEEVDKQLQMILNAYPSWEEAVQKMIWIVQGDSAQSAVISDRSKALIDLTKLLNPYTLWTPDQPSNKEIALAVNERMAYVYLQDETIKISDISARLRADSRIGFIAWKKGEVGYVISSKSDTPFTFSPDGPYTDSYGQSWTLSGDPALLDLSINEQNEISYGDYPDALARLDGALRSHEGRYIIIDAKPGYEFVEKNSPNHAGGAAHGSLHKVDSVVPLIVAGTDQAPKHQRLIDFKDWLIKLVK
ncbi:alkaline phosphatase family protein [Domibacillus sp. PGB-M46]|uniref:alkaline phosphatase family protein n=1 Tax=Domibacillus sp. PGB-M46 TaxID=2910255 RepID=UPI001F5A559B|nr:alkaline phosphatase family protein [Domibacillus sp. PGB-M46]MCI2257127.1 alkaline phosphatase family protein [Domibacillus sp. PGB-M46]